MEEDYRDKCSKINDLTTSFFHLRSLSDTCIFHDVAYRSMILCAIHHHKNNVCLLKLPIFDCSWVKKIINKDPSNDKEKETICKYLRNWIKIKKNKHNVVTPLTSCNEEYKNNEGTPELVIDTNGINGSKAPTSNDNQCIELIKNNNENNS